MSLVNASLYRPMSTRSDVVQVPLRTLRISTIAELATLQMGILVRPSFQTGQPSTHLVRTRTIRARRDLSRPSPSPALQGRVSIAFNGVE